MATKPPTSHKMAINWLTSNKDPQLPSFTFPTFHPWNLRTWDRKENVQYQKWAAVESHQNTRHTSMALAGVDQFFPLSLTLLKYSGCSPVCRDIMLPILITVKTIMESLGNKPLIYSKISENHLRELPILEVQIPVITSPGCRCSSLGRKSTLKTESSGRMKL